MTTINDKQILEGYDDQHVLLIRLSCQKVQRADGYVWILNHLFINPSKQNDLLNKEMDRILTLAQDSGLPLWPLDPLVISYFDQHPAFYPYWYHRPAVK